MVNRISLRSRVLLTATAAPLLGALLTGWWTSRPVERVITVAIAAVAAAFIAHRFVVLLETATAGVRRLADGQYGVSTPEEGPDEVRALAAALNAADLASARRDDQLNSALDDAASQRDLFYSIINASTEGLLLYDRDRRLVAANQRCAELLGFTMTELLNTDATVLQRSLERRSDDPSHYYQKLEAHFAHGDQAHQDILAVREPTRRILRRHSSLVTNHRGVMGRVFTYTDVTAESDLDRLKNEVLSMVSHGLRTPLTSIHGALQLALAGHAGEPSAENRELLEISLLNTERLIRLVNDLLDLSKIETRGLPFVVGHIDVASLLDEAARGLQALASASEVRIETRLPHDLWLSADRDQLLRVLTTLLDHAVRHSPRGGTVWLSARMAGDAVEVAIADEGPGLQPQELRELFRTFSVPGRHEKRTRHSGLGLAISRAIVERHRGRIWAESLEPHGARLLFSVPVCGAPELSRGAPAA